MNELCDLASTGWSIGPTLVLGALIALCGAVVFIAARRHRPGRVACAALLTMAAGALAAAGLATDDVDAASSTSTTTIAVPACPASATSSSTSTSTTAPTVT